MTSTHLAPSLNRLAVSATNHCLTGCPIGEALGLALATPRHRWLLSRGLGHALVTAHHAGHH